MKELMHLINEAAKNWERTKDEKYKEEWYRLLATLSRVCK